MRPLRARDLRSEDDTSDSEPSELAAGALRGLGLVRPEPYAAFALCGPSGQEICEVKMIPQTR
jgi:hypothetical protein